MPTIEQLAQRLEIAGRLLAAAAEDVRDLSLGDTKANSRSIGEALASIFAVQRAVFALRPELEPAYLQQISPHTEANKRLTPVLAEAYRLVDAGQIMEAVRVLKAFASTEPSDLHRDVALGEAERLKGRESDGA